jgi:hypothetical protein
MNSWLQFVEMEWTRVKGMSEGLTKRPGASRGWAKRVILRPLLLGCVVTIVSPGPAKLKKEPLEDLLKLSGAYCARLVSSALDFTCEEEIEEIQYRPRRVSKTKYAVSWLDGMTNHSGTNLETLKETLLYDYQLIRKNNIINERRTLIRRNGKDQKIENARLATHRIRYQELIMCPVGLLGPAAQKSHSYRLGGQDKVHGLPVYIIEGEPLPNGPPGLTGRAWINPADGSVLKIEWTPESLGQYELIVKFGKQISAKPVVKFVSEYDIEKNGIRFLSSHKATEAYRLFEGGDLYTRTKLSVVYHDFKFFTVETDVNLH